MPREISSQAVAGTIAIIESRGALVLARVLSEGLRHGLTLQMFLLKSGLPPEDVEAGLRAAVALRDAGLTRLERTAASASGNAEALRKRSPAQSVSMTTNDVSLFLGVTTRRVRQLALAGDLPSSRVGRGYLFDRDAVLGFRAARWAAA